MKLVESKITDLLIVEVTDIQKSAAFCSCCYVSSGNLQNQLNSIITIGGRGLKLSSYKIPHRGIGADAKVNEDV